MYVYVFVISDASETSYHWYYLKSKYVRKLRALKDAHLILCWMYSHTGQEAQPRLEQFTEIAPNSRQQSKTVNIKAHFRNEQSCIDEF